MSCTRVFVFEQPKGFAYDMQGFQKRDRTNLLI
ncbi:uncharacterized protein METZ01_LOCUS354385 [marine metagenome]|uniref:Uncharacterized protein n=1 Tax=marine metagenome TaxID=408172 RepID=A0A382RY05_9ZZZZ